jgi:asparagine synthase (glutamine-hydrolysing)
MMLSDALGYLPDDVLAKVDRASMAVSLEVRSPLLDAEVIALAARLPSGLKLRDGVGKWALRRLLARRLPPELSGQPKMGFAVPRGDWLRGPLRAWAEALLDPEALRAQGTFDARVVQRRWLEHRSGRRDWQHHLWSLLMFQSWLAESRRWRGRAGARSNPVEVTT